MLFSSSSPSFIHELSVQDPKPIRKIQLQKRGKSFVIPVNLFSRYSID
jgi:hypothetical protein